MLRRRRNVIAHSLRFVIAGSVVLLLSLLLVGHIAAEEALSPEALEIANQLNCPVCQGQSVRDSNSELARQMRQLIQEKLDRGESREQILQYFVDRYGVGVLREPPRRGYLWLLWWGPVVGFIVGTVILVLYLRSSRRVTGKDQSEQLAALETQDLESLEQLLRAEGEVR